MDPLTATQLRTPKAAAIAGILFSAMLITAIVLLWVSIPINPLDRGAWLAVSRTRVRFALTLVPFSGVAFLWFLGVLRDRLGNLEDRLFATVFLGSGLLFLATLYAAAAIIGAIIIADRATLQGLVNTATFAFARALAYDLLNDYAIRSGGVFMIVTSTLAIRTGFVARWIALVGYALALLLLIGYRLFDWNFAIFPLWVLLVSTYILIDNFRLTAASASRATDSGAKKI
jgi:hypothetical protein